MDISGEDKLKGKQAQRRRCRSPSPIRYVHSLWTFLLPSLDLSRVSNRSLISSYSYFSKYPFNKPDTLHVPDLSLCSVLDYCSLLNSTVNFSIKTESGNVEDGLCLPLQAPFVRSSLAAKNAPETDQAMKGLQRKPYTSDLLCPSAPQRMCSMLHRSLADLQSRSQT